MTEISHRAAESLLADARRWMAGSEAGHGELGESLRSLPRMTKGDVHRQPRGVECTRTRKRETSMPRLRQIAKAEDHPLAQQVYTTLFGDRDPVMHPGTATGTPGNWWTVFAGSPDIFDHAVAGFQLYRSPKRKLDPKLRELAQTRAGWARGSTFVYSQHCKAARSVGVAEEQITAIPHWQTATCYSGAERAVLAYTDCLVFDGGRTPD